MVRAFATVFIILMIEFAGNAALAANAPARRHVSASAPKASAPSCERRIQLRLTPLSNAEANANPGKASPAAAKSAPALFDLAVSCAFYDEVSVGDDLLRRHFRWGTFARPGAMEAYSLEVEKKYSDNPTYQGQRCEKMLVAGLSQSHQAIDFWANAKDTRDRTTLQIPVGCNTYDRVSAGENLIRAIRTATPRDGGVRMTASMGGWRLRIIGKRENAGALD